MWVLVTFYKALVFQFHFRAGTTELVLHVQRCMHDGIYVYYYVKQQMIEISMTVLK
jgi:hypothetical protein